MWPFQKRPRGLVHVEFVDASTQQVFAQSELPLEQLPDVLDSATTLEIAEARYAVVAAEPATKAGFAATGRLRLTLARIELVDPLALRYSLPTICDELPALRPARPAESDALRLRGDDWRQLELVAAELAADVERELTGVREILASDDGKPGFARTHLRRSIRRPLGERRLELDAARSALGGSPYPGLVTDGIDGRVGAVVDGFAWRTGSALDLYGTAPNRALASLCVASPRSPLELVDGPSRAVDLGAGAAALHAFATAHRLLLVDWCAAAVLTAPA
ncbi:MAG: hypothetical protein IPM29_00125 [Planctomycetes bacterium]|nr:hypothetical protein [Planctomycetota bacterium]